MRVLVTGNRGYIGPAVIEAIRAAQHEVVGLDSCLFVDSSLEAGPDAPTIEWDIRDVTEAHLHGVDALVHLAGLSNDPLGLVDPALTYQINAQATIRLAHLARAAGVRRFVFSSSCSVYGAAVEPWVDETTSPRPVTPYGESKLLAERGLRELDEPSFCAVSVRNATAFGYSPNLRTDLVVNDLVAGAYLNGEIRLNSDGSAWRPLIHIRDIAQAMVLILEAPTAVVGGQVINVGANAQNYTVMEIAQTVAALVPNAQLHVPDGAGVDRRSYRVRFDKVDRLLPGFHCRYDLRAGISDLLRNYQRVAFQAPEACVRLTALQRLQQEERVDAELRCRERRSLPV